MTATGTWELVDTPKGASIVGSKWVFQAKKNAAGNVNCYKARLVARASYRYQWLTISIHLHQVHICHQSRLYLQ